MQLRIVARAGWLPLALLALLLATAATGCIVESDGPVITDRGGPYLADLEVNWTLLGSDAPSRCAAYDIDRWVIHASGPEERETVLGCVEDDWTTANDFFGLPEGSYELTLTGIDDFDVAVVETGVRTPLVDDGRTLVLDIDLLSEDFLP
ncbi:MAG: hypothetical protein IPL40_07400 [Proteobacteria bacterium]|nr:hypothetical protein [Pseudomonadota bacterium]